jgi:sn-glycerol 3-phosphate transport system ATP-binding protein
MMGETENPSSLQFLKIRHRYGSRIILEDISFSATQGQWLCLIGESGSGKSTLLRIAAGLERPEQGSVFMLGSDQSMIPAHQRPIAWMSQTADCYEHLSVAENLAIAERLIRPNVFEHPIDIASWRAELIDELRLAPLMTRKPSAISGGERQRVAIARAMLSQRPILLLDEPLAHLNESMREKLGRKLREWTLRMRMTVLYVTHDSLEAAQLGDRIVILIGGRIEQIDAPKFIVDRPATERVAELTARLRRFGSGDIGP